MNLQYISDDKGKITDVIIPISEWNKLKSKFKDIDQFDIPKHQMEEVLNRLDDYAKNPDKALDFETAMENIEKDL